LKLRDLLLERGDPLLVLLDAAHALREVLHFRAQAADVVHQLVGARDVTELGDEAFAGIRQTTCNPLIP
jgi:hypothetical protein